MKEKKKSLKLKKSIIANFRAFQLKGGTDSNPCQVNTGAPSNGPGSNAPASTREEGCLTSEKGCTKSNYLSNEDVENCR